ncbi:hypothetical protein K1T71_004264 [Dendrolimus kikuchii]|uniref:Uncharacterized protein n=1 Tax=Dendrolimus kikuchii TaxID=765133 RepID=A0ACC1D6Z4_9NEOP|nr:hypothetical protein K1T71_004264 [Dendrolimus kikuchii]
MRIVLVCGCPPLTVNVFIDASALIMDFDTEKFIIEIQNRPAIWNTKSAEYSDKNYHLGNESTQPQTTTVSNRIFRFGLRLSATRLTASATASCVLRQSKITAHNIKMTKR